MKEPICLGQQVKDTVTGLVGMVTGRAEYMHSPPSCRVEAVDTTGRPIEWWLTESRLEVVG